MHYDISSFFSLEGEPVSYCMSPGKEKKEEEGRRGRRGRESSITLGIQSMLACLEDGEEKEGVA